MGDCCESDNKEKGGNTKMDKKTTLWIVIALLAILAIYVMFFRDTSAGQVVASSAGQVASSSGMVGGC